MNKIEHDDDRVHEMLIQAKGLTTAPRITPDHIQALLERVTCLASHIEGTTTTVVHAFLDEKYLIATAHSACVSPENFDEEVGLRIARDKVFKIVQDKLWEMEGYRLYMELSEEPKISGMCPTSVITDDVDACQPEEANG